MAGKLKLVELTHKPWADRWVTLKNFLRENFQIEFDAHVVETSREKVSQDLSSALAGDADICLVAPALSDLSHGSLKEITFESEFLGVATQLVREGKKWWSRPVLDEAFIRCLAEHHNRLDLTSPALIAGAGPASTLVIGAFAKLGFPSINVADSSFEKADKLVSVMRKKFFNVNFQAFGQEQLNTLPGIHSVVVNTTTLDLENHLLDELYFFNFLQHGGTVIDLTIVPAKTPLISEAEQWGARHLSGEYVAATRDALMIEKVAGVKVPTAPYRVALRALIDTVPFDPSPYLQRFRERGS